jgi:hypothetical protein
VGFAETTNPFRRGGESDSMSGLAGSDPQADRQIGFPGSGRT